MLFGFGIWVWCIPALALLIYLARHDTTTLWARIHSPPTSQDAVMNAPTPPSAAAHDRAGVPGPERPQHPTWRWRIRRDATIELWADRDRQLAVADPDGRNLAISCGAALHHLVVAGRALGVTPTVEPDAQPGRTRPARVHPGWTRRARPRRRRRRWTPSSDAAPTDVASPPGPSPTPGWPIWPRPPPDGAPTPSPSSTPLLASAASCCSAAPRPAQQSDQPLCAGTAGVDRPQRSGRSPHTERSSPLTRVLDPPPQPVRT